MFVPPLLAQVYAYVADLPRRNPDFCHRPAARAIFHAAESVANHRRFCGIHAGMLSRVRLMKQVRDRLPWRANRTVWLGMAIAGVAVPVVAVAVLAPVPPLYYHLATVLAVPLLVIGSVVVIKGLLLLDEDR